MIARIVWGKFTRYIGIHDDPVNQGRPNSAAAGVTLVTDLVFICCMGNHLSSGRNAANAQHGRLYGRRDCLCPSARAMRIVTIGTLDMLLHRTGILSRIVNTGCGSDRMYGCLGQISSDSFRRDRAVVAGKTVILLGLMAHQSLTSAGRVRAVATLAGRLPHGYRLYIVPLVKTGASQ